MVSMVDLVELLGLSSITYVPTNGVLDEWDSNNALKDIKKPTFYAILHSLLVNSWIPTSHRQLVTFPTVKLLYTLGMRNRICLGQFIFDNMTTNVGSKMPKHP